MRTIGSLQVGDDVWIHSITKSDKPTPCCLSVDFSVHGTVISKETGLSKVIRFLFKSDNGRVHECYFNANSCTFHIICGTIFGAFVVTTEPIKSKDHLNANACYQENCYVKSYLRRKHETLY